MPLRDRGPEWVILPLAACDSASKAKIGIKKSKHNRDASAGVWRIKLWDARAIIGALQSSVPSDVEIAWANST